MSKIAAEQKLELKHDSGVRRSGGEGLDPQAIVAIFNEPDKGAASASSPAGRIVFQILDTSRPNFNAESDSNKQMSAQLKQALADDLLTQYIQRLEKDYGVKISDQAVREAIGASEQ